MVIATCKYKNFSQEWQMNLSYDMRLVNADMRIDDCALLIGIVV